MKYRSIFLIIFALFLVSPSLVAAQKLSVEEILSRHLDSIAPAEKRASMKSLIAVGDVGVEYITQKNQPAVGRVVLASEGKMMFLGMNLNASDYPQEKIIHNGNKTSIAYIRSGSRSLLGNFINSSPEVISQGIYGGVLTSGWSPMRTEELRSRFSLSGTKKVEGSEAHVLRFNAKGGSDIEITLYFDTKTFRHVRTEYKRTSSASIGRNIDDSARQSESRISVTEDFSIFKEAQGMMVPHQHKVLYAITGARGTTEVSWTSQFTEFAVNQKLDPATFGTD